MADAPYCWIKVLHCVLKRRQTRNKRGSGQWAQLVGTNAGARTHGLLLGQGQIDASLSAVREELLFSCFVGQQTLKGRHHELANHTPDPHNGAVSINDAMG